MVALKAELGPMVPGVPGLSTPYWDLFVAAGSDALPGTGTALGTFNHNESGDTLHKGLNHVVYHHVQSILYRRVYPTGAAGVGPFWPYGFHDMSQIKIKRYGATMLSTSMTAAGVAMAPLATATLVVKGQPGDVAVANADCTFVSNNPAIATVSTAGVVTGVAVGNTVVSITNKFNGLMVDAAVAVTATSEDLLEGRLEEEKENETDKDRWEREERQRKERDERANKDVIRKDDEWPDDRQKVVNAEKDAEKDNEKDRPRKAIEDRREDKREDKQEEDLEAKKEAVDKAIKDREREARDDHDGDDNPRRSSKK